MSSINKSLVNLISNLFTDSDFSEKFVESLAGSLDVEESVVETAIADFFEKYEMSKSKKSASKPAPAAKKSASSSAKVDMKVVNKNITLAKKKSAEDGKKTYYNVSTGRLGTKSTKTQKLYVFKDKLSISGKEDCPKFAAVLKNLTEDDGDSSDTDVSSGEEEKIVKKPLVRTSSKAKLVEVSNSDDESEDEKKPKKKPTKKAPAKKAAPKKKAESSDEDESEDDEPKTKKPVKRTASKKNVKKAESEDETSEDEKLKTKTKKAAPKKKDDESSESDTLESEDEEPVKKPLAKTASKKNVKKTETDDEKSESEPEPEKKPVSKTSSSKKSESESEKKDKKKSEPEPEKKETKKDKKKESAKAKPEKVEVKAITFDETNESGFKYNEETGLVEHPSEPGIVIAMMDGDEMVELDDEAIESCGKHGVIHRTDKKGFSKFIASLTKGKNKEEEKKKESAGEDEDEEVEF
ncbi:hypothetical protein [Brazilian marseillevirus]|uniref:hypothetical protein n=1 Tax=Brazilian marseillevirus TaxID=1813599 RepID=UPI0007803976|nr:hypothetical protein A3303_gp420 [Brazilian marseillevirus]AMQ10928.1 hypothetical protein [Brazilian marseillevirus]